VCLELNSHAHSQADQPAAAAQGLESRELPDDRSRPGGINDTRERERNGSGEVPWCERCVGMTIFTKEMKDLGLVPMCAGLRTRFPYDQRRSDLMAGEDEQKYIYENMYTCMHKYTYI